LCRDAGQPRDRFGDRGVGQLADVLGGYDLDDRALQLLGVDRVLDALAQTRDDDFLEVGGVLLLCQRGIAAGGQENRETGRATDVLLVTFHPIPS
jgi:hypothetical protein